MTAESYVRRRDGEVAAAHQIVLSRAATLAAAGRHRSGSVSFGGAAPDTFRAVAPLPPLLSPVDKLPLELVPSTLRGWAGYHADQLQCPLEFVVVPAMVAAAGCMGRQVAIRLRRESSYLELPILWGACIGRPSTAKSPAQRPTVRIIQRLEGEMREAWARETAIRERQAEFDRLKGEQARRKAAQLISQGNHEGGRAILEELASPEEQVPEPRLMLNDCTVEKLAILLSQNPNGLLQVRDELTGWLSSLERDGANDRPFYLECWNGFTPFSVDRVTRQSIRVERPCLSIFGGIQPGRLDDYVRQAVRGGSGDDGLLQRFQLAVFPDPDRDWKFRDSPIDDALERSVMAVYRRLRNLDLAALHAREADWAEVPFVEMDHMAMQRYMDYVEPLMQRLRQGVETPAMESHLAKYQTLVGRLALVIHLLEDHRGPVGLDTMITALAWAAYLEPHARRLFGSAINPGLAAAHRLLGRLGDLPQTGFTVRDVVRRNWSGIDQHNAAAACETLVEHGHLAWTDNATEAGGRPTKIFWRRPE